jgi:cytochrome c
MRALRIVAIAAAALPLLACGPSGGGGSGKSDQQLLAELPAPYSTGDVAAGKQVFALCTACHTVGAGQPDTVGPNLHGIFGAKAAHRPEFKYSPGLKAAGWTWDAARIDAWIADPRAMVPDTKMVFIGVKDPKQRADVIAYLKVASSATQ